MTIYATFFTHDTNSVGVRAWDGHLWHDITHNLNDISIMNPDGRYYYVSDLIVVNGKLFATTSTLEGVVASRVMRYDNGVWVSTAETHSETGDNGYFDGFVQAFGRTFVFGYHETRFTIWEMDSFGAAKLHGTASPDFHFHESFAKCVIPSPTLPNVLILGDSGIDRFGYYNIAERRFYNGSDPGGSCIFAFGVDAQKVVWSGNYHNFYYYSNDGGITFSDALVADPSGPSANYPESWDMTQWGSKLVTVGCHPSAILHRTDHQPDPSLLDTWKIEYVMPGTANITSGLGFVSCVAESRWGGRLFVGFGGEPYYYGNIRMAGAVYAWDGKTLTDIGGGLDWGVGVHRMVGDGLNNLQAGTQVQAVQFW